MICAEDANGCETCDSAYIDAANGINTLAASPVLIYPNPSNGRFTIQLPNNFTGNITVSLYDLQSKLILSKEFQCEENNKHGRVYRSRE